MIHRKRKLKTSLWLVNYYHLLGECHPLKAALVTLQYLVHP